jgi:D-glycero-alpha-D-manno-heptose-7-phosphate kinase
MADIPAEGSGLGSSSALTVGLLNAFYAYQGKFLSQLDLAAEACDVEMEILGKRMGKQDQYGCAVGGVKFIWFFPSNKVEVHALNVSDNQLSGLESELMLFFTGITRQASTILNRQAENTIQKMDVLRQMRDQARGLAYRDAIQHVPETVGCALQTNWEMKKQLASGISTHKIDELYEKAMQSGARGGKITGAGGGGFFLVSCPLEKQKAVRQSLGLQELPFVFDYHGTRIIVGGENQ